MELVNFTEVWTDDAGTIAVRTISGDYKVYIDPTTFGREIGSGKKRRIVTLADETNMAEHITSTKLKILNALRRK